MLCHEEIQDIHFEIITTEMHHIMKHMSVRPNFSEVNLGILEKVVPARFFHCEVKIFFDSIM